MTHVYDALRNWLLGGGQSKLDVWAQLVAKLDTTTDAITAQRLLGSPQRIRQFGVIPDLFGLVHLAGESVEFEVTPGMYNAMIAGVMLFDRNAGQCLAFIECFMVLNSGPVFLKLNEPESTGAVPTTSPPAAKAAVCGECRGTGTVDLLFKVVPCGRGCK